MRVRVATWLLVATMCGSSCPAAPGAASAAAPGTSSVASGLAPEQAVAFARLALAGLDREYPTKTGETLTGPADLRPHRERHPAFFGCFDWHSSVHGHWMLVRLLRVVPDLPNAAEVRGRLGAHLTAAHLATEAAYFEPRENRGFERPYGWAWTLRLAAELRSWDDPDARRWAENIAPLERKVVQLAREFLPRLTYPVRTGVHPDTAFALAQFLDYSRAVGDRDFELQIIRRAREYYLDNRDYPTGLEPSGEDFFSPGLNVADLMRRVLSRSDFREWLDRFQPRLRRGDLGRWGEPAVVSDLEDPRIVHLVGLNLTRAWTLRGLASALDPGDRRRATLQRGAAAHAEAGLKYIFSGHYGGEHWLATFAVYYLTDTGMEPR